MGLSSERHGPFEGIEGTGSLVSAQETTDGESPTTWRQLIDQCVDGVMTARPVALEKVLRRQVAPEACG